MPSSAAAVCALDVWRETCDGMRGLSKRPVLVCDGHVDPVVEAGGFFEIRKGQFDRPIHRRKGGAADGQPQGGISR